MYTNQELAVIVANSFSYSEVLRKLGLSVSGNSHCRIKQQITELNLDTTHFDPYKIAKQGKFSSKKHWSEKLIDRSSLCGYKRAGYVLTKCLLETGRQYKCNKCGLTDSWCNETLKLEVDHINGKNSDDRPQNLQFLCPNCHSQKPIPQRESKRKRCIDCNKIIHRKSTRCRRCASKINGKLYRKVERPSQKQLQNEIKELGYCAVGRKYGVSDNAIRKWLQLE